MRRPFLVWAPLHKDPKLREIFMAAPNVVGLGTISTAIEASAVKESQLR